MVHYATFGIDHRWKRRIVKLIPANATRVWILPAESPPSLLLKRIFVVRWWQSSFARSTSRSPVENYASVGCRMPARSKHTPKLLERSIFPPLKRRTVQGVTRETMKA